MATERRGGHGRGSAAVELALALPLFLLFVFGLLECCRAAYLWNTLQEVTRRAARAAAIADFSDAAAMARLRQDAVLRAGAGPLPWGGAIDASYVRIDYLWQDAVGGALTPLAALPDGPASNVVNCTDDAHGASCIRFVRARLCLPEAGAANGAPCLPVPYRAMVPLTDGLLALTLPGAATVQRAEALGYRPGRWP